MPKIKKIFAREILDSRGNPTLECEIILESGLSAKASVPSGASTGQSEALELRDGNQKRYGGQEVKKAINNITKIIQPKLKGLNILDLKKIDQLMIDLDQTANKSRLGANAILAVSMAIARLGALSKRQGLFEYLATTYNFNKKYKFPTPAFNIFNGGAHASTNLDFQEFMIIPLAKNSLAEKIRIGAEVYHALGKVLKANKLDTDLGNEGGYAPQVKSREQVIEFIMKAIKEAGYNFKKVGLGFDIGSSEFYNPKTGYYELPMDGKKYSARELMNLYRTWLKKYPIVSIEDGLAEEDWANWQILTKEFGQKTLLIGDDLFTTNQERLKKGIKMKAANAILIKLNQIGTVSETIVAIKLAQKNNYKVMISHRSGETTDDFIADLAVACSADYIKAGAPGRGERLAKYNRLMEIELILKGAY